MVRKCIFLVVALALVFSLSVCGGPRPEESTPTAPATEAPTEPTPASPTPGQHVPTTELNPNDIEWLARVIASEAGSVYDKGSWVRCTDEERSAVGWTVLNRIKSGTYGGTIEEVVTAPGQYAHNQNPTPEIIELATRLLKGQIADVSGGATHFFSPISMPKEGEPTTGFDVREGIHHLYQVPGIDKNVYFPSWTTDHVWVGDLNNVRSAYFMFYRLVTPAPKAARILYVVDETYPYYTEEWPLHLKARGFQIETMTVTSALLDANLEGYGLIVVGYVLNSRVSVPVYISIANSGLPILNGSQWLVQLFGQGTNAFDGRTSYGESIHITSDHPLTKGYSSGVTCSQYPMYRNMIKADGMVLAKVTTTEKDQPPAPPGGPAPTPVFDVTGDVWSVKDNRIYFGFWPSGQDNVHYWAFFDRSVDYLLAEVSVATPAPTPPSPEAGETLRADFAADPTEGTAPLTVHFRDKSTGAITHWQWDFGDGESSELQNPDHQYEDAGKYTVSLTVTGGADSTTKTIENCVLVKHPLTEFYIGSKEAPAPFPKTLTVGQETSITLGIVNREGHLLSYWVRIVLAGEEVARTEPITLRHLEKWEGDVGFVPGKAGSNQRLEFELYREGDTGPYLAPLYLWVDVKP